MSIELSASTGHPQVDALLRGLVGVYQTVFPEGLRCLYVVGSYSDGSAVPGSDLDVGVVFNEPLTEEHLAQFRQITQSLALISSVRLDCGTLNLKRFTNSISAGLKEALVVYGENVFAELPLEPFEPSLRRVMSNTFHSLYVLRQRDNNLVYPLNYPDSTGEYYGYEPWGTYLGDRTFAPGVRRLVTSVTLIATSLVMMRSGERVASKHESVQAYEKYVGDEWTEFVQQVYMLCKNEWHYEMPKTQRARRQFRRLCAQMLAFENHFLARCRESVLSDLRHSEETIQQMALYRLKRIAYPGEDYVRILTELKENKTSQFAQDAEIVLDKLK